MIIIKSNVLLEIKELEKTLGRRPTKHDKGSLYNKSRKYFGSWNKMMETAGYKVKYYQYPKIPQKLTSPFSYFLGLLITDGHLQFKDYRYVYLFTSYKDERDIILKLIKRLFRYNSFVRAKNNGFNRRINFQIYINSKTLVTYLNNRFNIPTGNKSLIVRIPKEILNSNLKNKMSFLRGVIDGDGWVSQGTIRICSGSYKFLLDIKRLLHSIGIKHKSKIYTEESCYKITINKTDSKRIYPLAYHKANFFYRRKMVSLTNIFKNTNSNKTPSPLSSTGRACGCR